MKELLFFFVILLSNIIQGITGFAGTILAMPASIHLVGMDVAVPVLNVLGLLSGIYVFIQAHEYVNWKRLVKIVLVMSVCMMGGIALRRVMSGSPAMLYKLLGAIVITVSLCGLSKVFKKSKKLLDYEAGVNDNSEGKNEDESQEITVQDTSSPTIAVQYRTQKQSMIQRLFGELLLIAAGIVHGMFVCGGPFLIGYLTQQEKDKNAFRATISTCWIFLNGLLLITHIIEGMWTPSLIKTQLITIPFLIAGMYIGSILYKRMSQSFFTKLTYVLILLSGLSLFIK